MKVNLPRSKILSRRDFMRIAARGVVAGAGVLALPGCDVIACFDDLHNEREAGLGLAARCHGKFYGAAVQSVQLNDGDMALGLQREATLLVPETELKWDVLRPNPHTFNFNGYRRLAKFAEDNDMHMRGHVLVWHAANPKWLKPALTSGSQAEKILKTHITHVIKETSPLIRNWDVVNEAVSPHSSRADGLRETLWLEALGPDYIALAYHMAHEADRGLTLVYNDFGMEHGDGDGRRKRHSILALLEKCVRNNVPIHGLGLQSHLQAHRPLAGQEFIVFLRNVRALGLKIYITEFDLDVSHLAGRMDDKVKLAQSYVKKYLEMVQQDAPLEMLLTWGLSDRYSWLNTAHHRAVGALPLNRHFDRGPLWDTLRRTWLGGN